MGSIATAFGVNGSMSHANVHVGRLQVYNELEVEDNAHFESDVTVDGTLNAKGLKIGETTITEEQFKKATSGVNGIIDDVSEPVEKKVKLEEYQDQAEVNTGYKETNDMSDKDNYLQAKGVVSQDQVFSHTGFVANGTK